LRNSDLRGFRLPGTDEKLIAKLFADDTTVYLSEQDNYADLQTVTQTWCDGSRAKFNSRKTEIIPVGTPEYRNRVADTRIPGPNSIAIPPGANVARDTEAVRILGAWVGNRTSGDAAWDRIASLMSKNLTRWAKANPTLEGKRLIVSMEVGGRTQFLAKAQGMTKAAEAMINKLIRTFIWGDGKRPMVAAAALCADVSTGGLSLLDLRARNEAIDLVWLKAYLNLSPTRP
ncbi:hypothetical protein C8Q70DRAFT_880201, partial [Cubamyces menziesii]